MRIEAKAAITFAVGTSLWRTLLAGLAALALTACGGGGDEFEVTRSSNAWVAIDWNSANQGLRDDFVNLRGRTFMGANSVSWANKTNGKSGQADHGVGCSGGFFVICDHFWEAKIPIVTGANVIQVTASDGAGNFETEAITIKGGELTRPSISSAVPANGAIGIALNSLVTVVFSEDMDRSTITPTTVLLEDSFGNQVAAAVSSTRSSATLDPAMQLAWSTTYRATITSGVRDLAGNTLAAPHSWTFTTGVAPDTIPPAVASTTPPNGSDCVAVDGRITATFAEPITAATVTSSSFNLVDVNRNPISGAVSVLTATSFAFTPSSALSFSTTYMGTLTTAVKDLAGNSMATDYIWSFQATYPGIGEWQAISTMGSPTARSGHTSVWTGTEMIIWGGVSSTGGVGPLQTGGRYKPASDIWVPTSTVGAPSGRRGSAAVWTGSEMIVWGGATDSGFTNDGARYDPLTDTWTPISALGAPLNRSGATAIWTGTDLLVYGGSTDAGGARYNPATDSWRPLSAVDAPIGRIQHTAIWTGNKMIVWGGTDTPGSCAYGSACTGGGVYDPITNTWEATGLVGAPAGLRGHTAVWTGSEMAIWGGEETSGLLVNSGTLYNPQTKTWRPMSTGCAPSARSGHTAIWSGSEMIIWGGWNVKGFVHSGSRYDPISNSWQHLSVANVPTTSDSHTAVWTDTSMIVWRAGYFGAPMGMRYQP